MATQARQPVFRFAPSPNGLLHLGHARSALLNHDMSRQIGGRFLLRIEDIDRERCRPGYETALLRDLEWLGLTWEQPVRRQSEHFADYRLALAQLADRRLIYPCFCSRAQISAVAAGHPAWPRDPDGAPLYPGTCRHLDEAERRARLGAGKDATQRLDMARALAQIPAGLAWHESGAGVPREVKAEPQLWGDAVLARKDVPTSYHLSVVVDDALQGVSHVVRGADLFQATAIHVVLQHLLGLPQPHYHHHALLRDGEGQKLSKSLQSQSLASLRAERMTPAQVRQLAGCDLQGRTPAPYVQAEAKD